MYDYERDGREQRVYTSMKREREGGGKRGNSHKWARLESGNREEYEMSLCVQLAENLQTKQAIKKDQIKKNTKYSPFFVKENSLIKVLY